MKRWVKIMLMFALVFSFAAFILFVISWDFTADYLSAADPTESNFPGLAAVIMGLGLLMTIAVAVDCIQFSAAATVFFAVILSKHNKALKIFSACMIPFNVAMSVGSIVMIVLIGK